MHLLTDPVFHVTTTGGHRAVSLPDLLTLLGDDAIESIDHIQRHQQDAFYVFLASLAAMAIARFPHHADPNPWIQPPDFWRDRLRRLADPWGDTAWQLIQDDWSIPAFLQPPLTDSGSPIVMNDDTLIIHSPDSLDYIRSAQNHEIKNQRGYTAPIDQWIYSLISLQTFANYRGRGHHGNFRAVGARNVIEVTRSLRFGLRWQDAVRRLLTYRDEYIASFLTDSPSLIPLLWLVPWKNDHSEPQDSHASQIPATLLDPLAIEVCRRVRLRRTDKGYEAIELTSQHKRVNSQTVHNDPWNPLKYGKNTDTPNAFVLRNSQGFTASILSQLIFAQGGWHPAAMQIPCPDWPDGDLWFTASAVAYDSQKHQSAGYHNVAIRIPHTVVNDIFGGTASQASWGALSQSLINRAGDIHQILEQTLTQAAPHKAGQSQSGTLSQYAAYVKQACERFTKSWEAQFFDFLWQCDPHDANPQIAQWVQQLHHQAQHIVEETIQRVPISTQRLLMESQAAYLFQRNTQRFSKIKSYLKLAQNSHLNKEETVHVK